MLAFDQAGDIEPRGVQRLQDVVAGRRQESRLGDAGVFGRALGQRQLGIQPGQLFGAVTPSGTALNGVVSAGTFLPNASNNPCFFNVDVFG